MPGERRWWTSLRIRLTVLYVLLVTLATAALGLQIYRWTSEDLLSERRMRLLTEARITADAVAGVVDGDLQGAYPTLETHARRFNTRFLLLDTAGEVQADSLRDSTPEDSLEGQTIRYPELESALAGDSDAGVYRLQSGEYAMYGAVPVVRGGEVEGALLVAGSLNEVVASLSAVVHRLLAAGLVINIVIAVVTWVVARRLTSPLMQLNRAARRLGSGDLQTRVNIQSTDETGDLAETFNDMAQRLEEHDRMQRRFVSDASHELRSPIGSAMVLLEALESSMRNGDRSLFSSLHEQLRRMSRLVNQLLELARLEEWDESSVSDQERADAQHVVRRVLRRLEPMASARRVHLKEHLQTIPPILGSEENLERVVQSLVENAIKYTPTGGHVSVDISATATPDPGVRLTVRDNGPGISPEDLPHIFDRFYRADASRSRGEGGFGLGLAIAKRRVEVLGGSIDVDSQPGQGTTFSVNLPPADTST